MSDFECLDPLLERSSICKNKTLISRSAEFVSDLLARECTLRNVTYDPGYQTRRRCIDICQSAVKLSPALRITCDSIVKNSCQGVVNFEEHLPKKDPRSTFPDLTPYGKKCACYIPYMDDKWIAPFYGSFKRNSSAQKELMNPTCLINSCANAGEEIPAYKDYDVASQNCKSVKYCIQDFDFGTVGGSVNISASQDCGDEGSKIPTDTSALQPSNHTDTSQPSNAKKDFIIGAIIALCIGIFFILLFVLIYKALTKTENS